VAVLVAHRDGQVRIGLSETDELGDDTAGGRGRHQAHEAA
jgi:hypothetical protein